jgi:Ca2+-dependent lipid-binding protein
LIEAKLTRDTEMFSKMDPYAKIAYREQNFRSKTLNNAGKLPKWNETFEINVKYIGDDLEI